MGHSRFGLSTLVAAVTWAFLVVDICPIGHAAQKISPTASLPRALRDRLSPLTSRQVVYYGELMKRGGANAMADNVLYEFCKSGRLLCSVALHESVWGAVIDANTASSRNFPTSNEVSFGAILWSSKTNFSASFAAFLPWRSTTNFPTAYFREKDLEVGAKLVLPPFLYEPSGEGEPSFLPASLARSLPSFDSHHLRDLLQLFHIPSDSRMAQQVKKVLGACDEVQSLGRDDNFTITFCATSFEDMLNFASSMLRASNHMIQALTNSKVVGRPGSQVTIVRMVQLAIAQDAVACHELTLPFRVMGCHRIKNSKTFMVRLASEDSLTMDLLVACHKNTTLFNPHHLAFFQLKSSPGHTDICHFVPNDDTTWIPLQPLKSNVI